MSSSDRELKPTGEIFRADANIPWTDVTTIEGNPIDPGLAMKIMIVAGNMRIGKARRKKGFVDGEHQHDDHDSLGFLISGRLQMKIGGKEFIAGPGDVWHHPRGVPHSSVALEDVVQLEIKSPPRRTFS